MRQKGFTQHYFPNKFNSWKILGSNKKISTYIKPVKNSTGFTLIELLVVISVIGLLASVVLVALNQARAKARDTKRVADLKQFSTALELCYDKRNAYDINNETHINYYCNREPMSDSDFLGNPDPPYSNGWQQKCGEFLAKVPTKDPSGVDYLIHTTADDQHYILAAQMETTAYTQNSSYISNFISSVGITDWGFATATYPICSNYNYVIGH